MTDPATGEVIGDLPHATMAELDEAVATAARAFPGWRGTPALERSSILRRTAALLREGTERIATIMVREQGKPIVEARGEIAHALELFEWYAEEGRRVYDRVIPARSNGVEHLVRHGPVGPAAALTPWNFPALTPARKLAAGLAAGCPVILKASEETPGTAVEIVRALHDAGLPAGCAQLVFGVPAEVSERLITAPDIRKISLTGSTAVGKHLALAAAGVKRTTIELGGNAPVIVFEDADLDRTIATLAAGKFRNAGQVCVSPARFFVHESLHDRFVAELTAYAGAIQLGSGLDCATGMGPLANGRRVEAMERFVADAEARGGTITAGGSRRSDAGHFFHPTVVTGLDADSLLFSKECFGPVLPIASFATVEEVLKRANAVAAGLAGYAFTRGIANMQAAMHGLRTDMVGINSLAISAPEHRSAVLAKVASVRRAGLRGWGPI